jgi:hypothetical protein
MLMRALFHLTERNLEKLSDPLKIVIQTGETQVEQYRATSAGLGTGSSFFSFELHHQSTKHLSRTAESTSSSLGCNQVHCLLKKGQG